MHILSIIRIVGLLVALFSSTMLLPAMVAFGYRDGGGAEFVSSFLSRFCLACCSGSPTAITRRNSD